MRARHKASVKTAHNRPETKAKMTARSRRYWADPQNRKAAGELQREKWQDPEIKAKRLVGIDRAWECGKRREKQADSRLKAWKNPEFRNKTVEAMRTGKRGIKKRQTLELAREFPNMTPLEIAEKADRRLDNVLHDLRNARRDGILGIRPGDGPRLRKKAGL